MYMKYDSQRGITASVILAVIAVVIVMSIAFILAIVKYFSTTSGPAPLSGPTVTNQGALFGDQPGTLLAGTSAKLLDFTKAEYDAALATDKVVVLYFYANWCPICLAEFPKMQEVFNELTTDKVIGFRINYNDSLTDTDEQALARQYGITYQHTKVLLKNGQVILKAPDSWEKDRYLTEINNALAK